jgi:lauroyl/myristoyl acyltransferase
MIGAVLYRLGAFLAGVLPQDPAEKITEAILRPQYWLRIRSRRNVCNNLRIVLGSDVPDDRIRRLARQTFSNFARSIYYFLRVPSMSPGELAARCDTNGIDRVLGGIKGGFILVGPHLGCWEVGGARLAQVATRIQTVALPHSSRHVTRFFERQRRLLGVESFPLNGSAGALRRVLRNGGRVALLVDRAYGNANEEATWFGRTLSLPIGYAALSVLCRVPIITCACVFGEDGRFKLIWNGPYHPETAVGRREAVRRLRDTCLRDMESFIREYPDQWFNFFPFGSTGQWQQRMR